MTLLSDVQLLEPISAERPCGEDLEDSPLLSALEASRLFGQTYSPEAPPPPDKDDPLAKPVKPVDWPEVRELAAEALAKSKDLRVLAYLATANLRNEGDGMSSFAETLSVASQWLDAYWADTYPVVGDNGMSRRNALNCFADHWAVIDRLRRLPLIANRHGRFGLRDIEISNGKLPPAPGEGRPDQAQISAAFDAASVEDLTALKESIGKARAAVKNIDDKMRSEIGDEAAPSFETLQAQLAYIDRELKTRLAARQGGEAPAADPADGAVQAAPATVGAPGVIRSREDAIRALDAVAAFFRQTEPSSPIPLFVDRAKRLVSKNFLEVLADVAPEALGTARAAGGLRSEQHEE